MSRNKDYTIQHLNELVALYQKDKDKQVLEAIVDICIPTLERTAMSFLNLPYANFRVTLEDLIQEGSIVLLRAVKRYDTSKGENFMTKLITSLGTNLTFIFVRDRELLSDKATSDRRKQFPVIKYLDADDILIDNQLIIPQEFFLSNLLSIDYLTNLCVPSPENEYIQLEFLESINKIMLKLTDKERFIVEQRLLGEREATLQELGDLLGLTRERIRQIYNKALKKLRFWLNKIAKEFFGKPLCFDW